MNAKTAERAESQLEPERWVKESHDLARSDVYTAKILEAVTAGEFTPKSPLKKVNLDGAYEKRAQEIAEQRVAEAGYRLAQILKLLD